MREAESLQETLEFLDEALRGVDVTLDGDDISSLKSSLLEPFEQELDLLAPIAPPQEGPRHQSEPRGRRKKNYNQNKARQERHAELVKLRGEVENLEFTLKRLETIRGKRCSGSLGHKGKETNGKSAWKEACVRQLKRRLRAERENMHLRKCIEKDKQLVKSMQNLLVTRPALWNMVYPGTRQHTRRIEIPTGYMREMADLIFDELAVGVEASYREVEGLDRAVSPLLACLPTCEPLLRHAINGRRIEAFCYNDVPFGMTETGNAWWRYWNSYRGEVDSVDDVVTESFGWEISDAANTSATFYVQQILRRHVENHRTVFVWNGYFEPFLFKGKRIRGVYYREQSYVLIKPITQGKEESSRVSSCEMITPYILEPSMDNDPTVAAVTKFVVSSMSSDIITWNEMVESLLLDQARQN
ncbi:hypothetical protein PR003_g14223 [Phytophthora rubi]|uniref:Uncharacterized protein n=1 Tax=Phytophthora rubi TaxID=129364 RepID=A0A6A3LN30_9STRA|nr:hypothetical protein PR001_g13547 [Phytophthora rubi]KAE9333027.1 hypothetical protein PR003_g14223 [Phytophthora rubi]